MLPRVQGVEYDLTHHGDSFFIRTNDGAKTFRVVEAPVADCSKANWKEILSGAAEVTIEGVSALAGYLVFEERERGLGKIRIRSCRLAMQSLMMRSRAKPIPSIFPSRFTASGLPATPSTTPSCCASPTRRW